MSTITWDTQDDSVIELITGRLSFIYMKVENAMRLVAKKYKETLSTNASESTAEEYREDKVKLILAARSKVVGRFKSLDEFSKWQDSL